MTLQEKIKKQIEFYFSNANMRTDKFLQTKSKENDGWIDINTLLLFSKLKALSTDPEIIREAIKDSDVVEIKVDDILYVKKIVNDDYLNYLKMNNDKKVLVIKGVDKDASFDEIEKYLASYFDFVIMRMVKDKNKKFIGTVFVELRKEEDVDKVLDIKIPLMVIEKPESAKETDAGKQLNEGKTSDNVKSESPDKNKDLETNKEEPAQEAVKKQKLNDCSVVSYLSIQRKIDYFKERQEKQKTEKEGQRRENILAQLNGKFYKFTVNKDVDIKTIKKIVENVAFVDLKNFTLRFKKDQEFEEKTYQLENTKIELKKLTQEEETEYVKDIKFTDILSKGKRKQKTLKK